MAAQRALRASDQDRELTAALLGEHFAAGRLDFVEFDDRLSAAYSATTAGQLDALTHDLPAPDPGPSPAQATASDGRAPWQGWLLTAAICLLIWAATSAAQGRPLYFWPGWVIGPWGLVLAGRQRLGLGCRA